MHSVCHCFPSPPGPKSETVVDFWRMVWQEKVPTIAMVTRLREQSSKCQRYWPEVGSIDYGPYRVSLTEQEVLTDYILCTLEVQFITVSLQWVVVASADLGHVHVRNHV